MQGFQKILFRLALMLTEREAMLTCFYQV